MAVIAFLGLGLMGQGMAVNLINAGHQLRVWNRTADKCQPLVDLGASAAGTPAIAVAGADTIITIVGDDLASEAVWLGSDGVLSGQPAPGAVAIESTTVSQEWMVKLGEKCEDSGLRFLDCPVTGGPDGAANGRLTLLVGGEKETLLSVKPVFDAYAKTIYHFGPVGAGTAYKLIVNAVGAVQAVAVAEAMLVAQRVGLPLEKVADALGKGSVASALTTYIAPRMATEDHDDVRFAAKWRGKDVGYCCSMSDALGCDTPIFKQAADVFRRAVESGFGELNESAIQKIVRKID